MDAARVVHRNRADVVFLINGIPVAVVETKSANKQDGLAEGVEQIRRYHAETPEMFTTAQLFGVTQMLELFLWRNMERQPQKPVQLEDRRIHKLRGESQDLL